MVAAAVLAVPVVVWIYVLGLARSRAARPVLVVGLIVVSSMAAVTVPETLARPPSQSVDRVTLDFQPVELAAGGLSRPGFVSQGAEGRGAVAAVVDVRVLAMGGPRPVFPAPEVIRFRPRDGWTGVSTHGALSVRFSQPMERRSTARAFGAQVTGQPITGRMFWVEGDRVLVLVPSRPLPFGARVRLSVAGSARSALGVPIRTARSALFRVVARPAPAPSPAPSATGWQWPLIGPITQRFGESLTRYGFHQGIDINGETGDPVRAARRGRVIVAGYYDECGGLDVHIDHGDGFVSWYRHLSRVEVPVGRWVAAGDLIGRVGNTGCSFGSHLHFGIQRRGEFVDPERYLPRR
jgi:murein DD-endopeptidase MepM/ murein hydrolase activator NlpD